MILSKISNRLLAIANLIKKDSIIADVCSDHALLGCYLLSNSFCKFVYNIDINNEPLQSGIKNLTKYGVIEKSCNILADGLNTNEIDKHIDTCVIAGIGSNAIINILNNKNKSILIDEYIFVPSEKQNNIFLLRQ
jgi:tRNA (adenine22-N1)-methyltransferase